jgi:hypothetical protein
MAIDCQHPASDAFLVRLSHSVLGDRWADGLSLRRNESGSRDGVPDALDHLLPGRVANDQREVLTAPPILHGAA